MKCTTFVCAIVMCLTVSVESHGDALNEPTGFFGLEFGQSLQPEHIFDVDDPKFIAGISNLTPSEQALGRGEWLQVIFGDGADIPTDVREVLEEELQNTYFFYVLNPPVPNQLFAHYIAVVTPETGRLGAIWAYGTLDPCVPTIRHLAEHLLERYSALEVSLLTSNFRDRYGDFVELHSENVRISIMCSGIVIAHRHLESEAERELEAIFERIANRFEDRVDKSGL